MCVVGGIFFPARLREHAGRSGANGARLGLAEMFPTVTSRASPLPLAPLAADYVDRWLDVAEHNLEVRGVRCYYYVFRAPAAPTT